MLNAFIFQLRSNYLATAVESAAGAATAAESATTAVESATTAVESTATAVESTAGASTGASSVFSPQDTAPNDKVATATTAKNFFIFFNLID